MSLAKLALSSATTCALIAIVAAINLNALSWPAVLVVLAICSLAGALAPKVLMPTDETQT